MAYSLQQSINFVQTFIQYIPLTAGTGNEPAVSVANTVISTITSAPMCWGWNRNEFTGLVLTPNVQDYNNIGITDFGFLEKVSLKTPGSTYGFELKDIYNTNALGIAAGTDAPAQPNAVSVKLVTYGSSVSLRFLAPPDLKYTVTLTYQKLPTFFTSGALTEPWPIPDQYLDIYNNLFLAEMLEVSGDSQEAARYRMRGVAALLSKAEGLTDIQRSAFLSQYLARDSQALTAQLRTQQGQTARGV